MTEKPETPDLNDRHLRGDDDDVKVEADTSRNLHHKQLDQPMSPLYMEKKQELPEILKKKQRTKSELIRSQPKLKRKGNLNFILGLLGGIVIASVLFILLHTYVIDKGDEVQEVASEEGGDVTEACVEGADSEQCKAVENQAEEAEEVGPTYARELTAGVSWREKVKMTETEVGVEKKINTLTKFDDLPWLKENIG